MEQKEIILTVDLEFYYPGNNKGEVKDFDSLTIEEKIKYDNGRIEKSISTILKFLHKHNQKITFFVVAELDKFYSKILKEIIANGHEIALHSFDHKENWDISHFEKDLEKCSSFQKKYDIVGYRMPRIKITKNHYPLLKKFKYIYDSSIYGTRPFSCNGIKVIPVSILPYFKKNIQDVPSPLSKKLLTKTIPFGGGMFAGLLQKKGKFLIDRYISVYKKPPCIFLHSWQINNSRYPLKSLIKNPSFFSYSLDCKNMLEFFCERYKLTRIKDYLK